MAMANTGRVKVKGRLIKHWMRSFQIWNSITKKIDFSSLLDDQTWSKIPKIEKKLIFKARFNRWLINRKKSTAPIVDQSYQSMVVL